MSLHILVFSFYIEFLCRPLPVHSKTRCAQIYPLSRCEPALFLCSPSRHVPVPTSRTISFQLPDPAAAIMPSNYAAYLLSQGSSLLLCTVFGLFWELPVLVRFLTMNFHPRELLHRFPDLCQILIILFFLLFRLTVLVRGDTQVIHGFSSSRISWDAS